VAEAVALFTHCWAVQLSEFCQPSRRMHARIKNCKFFVPNESKSLFYSAHMHVCVSTKLGRALNNVARSSSILKHFCSLCEA